VHGEKFPSASDTSAFYGGMLYARLSLYIQDLMQSSSLANQLIGALKIEFNAVAHLLI
jgi:hypothetical protein